jgi:thiamine-phosphate pyrophosphorylase
MAADVRLYALVDPARAGARALGTLAREVAAGGATLIQLRDKAGGTRRLVEEARAVKAALSGTRVPLLINDRVDVALAAQGDGVHLGQDDMRPEDARALLGSRAIIGWTVRSQDEADAAPLSLLDYVAVGGVFATASKDNATAPIGVAGLRTIAASLRARAPHMPIVAIAGIDRANAAETIAAGADGIAVISALSLAPDPAAAARELRVIVEAARAARADRESAG